MILAGVKKIVFICQDEHKSSFIKLLGDGHRWGLSIEYVIQAKPEGIPQAFWLAEKYLDSAKSIFLGLGDNVLYGPGAGRSLNVVENSNYAQIYCFPIANPKQFGVIEIGQEGAIISIEEKPDIPKSNLAITGFYHFPFSAIELSKKLKKSIRGEFEIVELIQNYKNLNLLKANVLPRGTAWLDAGSPEGLLESSEFVSAIQKRQGLLIGSPDEAAWRVGLIGHEQLISNSNDFRATPYGEALRKLVTHKS